MDHRGGRQARRRSRECLDLDDYSMHGMKSHDCHVFMERLIPLTFRDLLPEPVWNALTELSQFFRDLCSTVLSESNMKKMEENIVVTLFLNTLKRKVKNKARVEGSIVEAYLIEETSTFCSHFFAPNVETRSRTIGRNDNINQVEHVNRLSVFNSNCRPFSPKGPFKILNQHEKDACAIYILLNSPEISEYVELYDAEKQAQLPDLTPHALGLIRDKELTTWFYNYVENPANQITNNDIKRLSRGFNNIVKCWNGHIVNGYRFHTIEYGKGKSTMNSGVSISGSYYNDSTIEYYSELLEIVELSFLGPGDNTVVMFKCKWFDSGRLGTKIHPRYNIVDINSARSIAEDNPFVLASQCHQVYYTPYPWRKKASDRNWRAVFRVQARSTYEISHTSIPSEQTPLEEFYEETSSSNLAHVVLDNELDEIDILIDVHREEEEVNPDELHLHERELDQEIEFDDLEEELVESDEEELLEYSDTTMQPTRGRYTRTYMSLLNGNVKALVDLHEDLAEHNDMAEHDNLAEHDDMAEHDDLADEEVHPGMDDLPHGIEQKESDCKDEIERDEVGREILIIVENCFVSIAAPRTILSSLRRWYNGVWPTFTKIPDWVKQELFDLFKGKFTWRDPWSEEQVFKIWKSYFSRRMTALMSDLRNNAKSRDSPPPKWMRKEIWDGLWDIWDTPKFKNLQNRYRQNRLSDRNGLGVALNASGSISIHQHARRMSKKNGGNPVLFEKTFERCHRRNKGQGPFVDKKSKNTLETYTEKLKQNQSQSDGPTMLPSIKASCIIYPEAWAEASSGPKFGRCYGFGTSYSESSSSSIHSSSINRSQGIKDGITSLSMYPIQHPSPGHLSASAPGYFPPHPGYYPSPGYYPAPPAPGQHHPFQYQPSSRDHSPDEHHTRD
ncbi:hypothetical protein BUALT_Bualt16G0077300 [Buddleja alternifolia]|uniref:Uncharacterized protein n=1 Tax=Buddleja alternifolia TaxID=168488 RepID=A0AAV6WI67_9LAMI|nr:hypothetical protein BUALT_Bualt16G0077300 [Buddleja alternifolia]